MDEEVQGKVELEKWAEKLEAYYCGPGITYWYCQLECRGEDGQKQMYNWQDIRTINLEKENQGWLGFWLE